MDAPGRAMIEAGWNVCEQDCCRVFGGGFCPRRFPRGAVRNRAETLGIGAFLIIGAARAL
eukprot:3377483-Pyramimonas_sp.AAC.2